jgi:two-component system, OmpR family, sensor kinase
MLSLRVKLTLYYLALLTAVLVFFGVAVYTYLARSLVTIIDDSLAHQARAVTARMTNADAPDGTPDAPDGDELLLAPQILQIIDEQGQLADEPVATKPHKLPVNMGELGRLAVGGWSFSTALLPSGEQIRLVTYRAEDAERRTFYVRVGQSLSPLQRARRHLSLLLGIVGPVALLLGSYGGLLLANQALRPVDRLTRAAQEIGAGDLSKRVPVPPQQDELGRLATTFNRMISRLQAAFERQRQFTSDASHELRTPLAVMRGDIEISLRRERTPQEYQRVLASNLEEIVRLTRLVEDLLMLARADSNQSLLRAEPMAVDELCEQTVEYLTPLAEQKSQTIVYEPPAERPLEINGDAQRLKQMLLNLIDNAIKYTPAGGKVTVSAKREGKEAVLRVADTGRGIPAEDLPHIFERFFRHSRNTSDKTVVGFGLGLSIVKWIVDSHGGRIEATSKVGEGTTFTVRLPLL